MPIRPERVREFMRLYEQEFGEAIGEDEALEMVSRLVELYQLLAMPLSGEKPASRDQDQSKAAEN